MIRSKPEKRLQSRLKYEKNGKKRYIKKDIVFFFISLQARTTNQTNANFQACRLRLISDPGKRLKKELKPVSVETRPLLCQVFLPRRHGRQRLADEETQRAAVAPDAPFASLPATPTSSAHLPDITSVAVLVDSRCSSSLSVV